MGCIWSRCGRLGSGRGTSSSEIHPTSPIRLQPPPLVVPDPIAPDDPPSPTLSKSSDGIYSPLSTRGSNNLSSLNIAINNRRWRMRGTNITTIANKSDVKIALKEKHREVWGRVLYTIEPGSSVVVQSNLMAGTFVWMEVVWGDDGMPVVPPLRIDSDELPAHREFAIKGSGGRLFLERSSGPN